MPTYKMCIITVNYNPKKTIYNVNKDVPCCVVYNIKIEATQMFNDIGIHMTK